MIMLISITILYSCRHPNEKSEKNISKDVKMEIESNKSNIVFLNLFPGMSSSAFEYLIKEEIKSNLKVSEDEYGNDKFYEFKIKDNLYKFRIINGEWYVNLSYDEKSDRNNKQYLEIYRKYSYILAFLLDTYSQNYKIDKIDFSKFKSYFEADYTFREPNNIMIDENVLKEVLKNFLKAKRKDDFSLFQPSSQDEYFFISNDKNKKILFKSSYRFIVDEIDITNNREELKFEIYYFSEESLINMKKHLNNQEDDKKNRYYESIRKDSLLKKNEIDNIVNDL